MDNKVTSAYIHIPFCHHICGYCDFTKLIYKQDWAESYMSALFDEIDSYKVESHSLKSIYIGGGTPSVLPIPLMIKLFEKVSPLLQEGGEFSIEINPESLDKEKAELFVKYGINRVSMGIESSFSKYLELMEREHSFEQAKQAISLLREVRIDNINADMIFALPGESEDEAKEDAKRFVELGLPHLSAYSLILEDSTKFKAMGLEEADEDEQAFQLEDIIAIFKQAGYIHYEVSNFAKEGYQCKHNLVYWKDERYYGWGLGASGFIGDKRYTNTKSLPIYLNKDYIEEEYPIYLQLDAEYYLLTNLRLLEGFSLKEFKERFGFDFLDKYGETFKKHQQDGCMVNDGGRIKPTEKGILLLDYLLRDY